MKSFLLKSCLLLSVVIGLPMSFAQEEAEIPTKSWNLELDSEISSLKNMVDKDFSQLNEAEQGFIKAFLGAPLKVSQELYSLQDQLLKELDRLENSIGKSQLIEKITSSKKKENIEVEIEGIGKAEVDFLSETKRLFFRVTHFGTHKSYVFLDGTGILPSEEEYRKYVLKQYYLGGQSELERYSGIAKEELSGSNFETKKTGRETITVYTENSIHKAQRFERAEKRFDRMKDWWKTMYRSPFPDGKILNENTKLGLASGGAQALVALGISGIQTLMFPEQSLQYAPAIASLVFGGVIGVWNNTYRNLIGSGSHKGRVLRGWMVSLSFSYIFLAGTIGPSAFMALSVPALLIHLHVFANNAANNMAKVHMNNTSRDRERSGDSLGKFSFKLPNYVEIPFSKYISYGGGVYLRTPFPKKWTEKEFTTSLERPGVESQIDYLKLYTLKIADLTGISAPIPGLGNVPIGKILFWMAIPYGRYRALRSAEKHGYRHAEELRIQWEEMKFKGVPYLGFFINIVKKTGWTVSHPFTVIKKIRQSFQPKKRHFGEDYTGQDVRSYTEFLLKKGFVKSRCEAAVGWL